MTKKSYAKHITIFLWLSAVLTLFVYVLVKNHRDVPEQVREQRSRLLGASSTSDLAERIKPVGQVALAVAQPRNQIAQAAVVVAPARLRGGQEVYQSGCIACHGAGIAGAPKFGDKNQWAKRVAKGRDALYASAIGGLRGSAGVMPPKGGNTSLSEAEVKAAVDYIVAASK